MTFRSAVILSIAFLTPLGAHAQADQQSINMCVQQVCLAPGTEGHQLQLNLEACTGQSGNPNCDAVMFAVEEFRSQCSADCANDPDGTMSGK